MKSLIVFCSFLVLVLSLKISSDMKGLSKHTFYGSSSVFGDLPTFGRIS